jgi:pimeloyl-ACP methyl ester carboxylesterase
MTREDITFASGGTTCAAWLYVPEGAHDPAPCVVMAHGFGGTRADAVPDFAERFVEVGMAVLLFDYRHFGDSEGEPRQLVDIGLQLEDWTAAIACARTRDQVDETRIALWGSSFSGGHVVATAVRDGQVRAVISQGPFADGLKQIASFPLSLNAKITLLALRDQFQALIGRPPHYVPVIGPPGSNAVLQSPESEPGYMAIIGEDSRWRNECTPRVMLRVPRYRPFRLGPQLTCPWLVCIADRDDLTPPQIARELAEAGGADVRGYDLSHFDIYRGAGFEQVVGDQAGFLQRHLGEVRTVAAPIPSPG